MIDNPNFLSQPMDTIVDTMVEETVGPDGTSILGSPNLGTSVSLGPDTAARRAERYAYGVKSLDTEGEVSTDKTAYMPDIMRGADDSLRERYALIDELTQRKRNSAKAEAYLSERLYGGTPITQEDVNEMDRLSITNASDPKDVFERAFASKAVTDAFSQGQVDATHVTDEAEENGIPKAVLDGLMEQGTDVIAAQQYVNKKVDEVQEFIKNRSNAEKRGDFLFELLPFAPRYAVHNSLKLEDGTSILPGNNMEETADAFYKMPPAERYRRLDEAVEYLKGVDPNMALQLLQNLKMYGSSDKFWDNMLPLIDTAVVASPALIGKGVQGAVNAASKVTSKVKTVLQTTAKATSPTAVKTTQVLSAAGETAVAGGEIAKAKLAEKIAGSPALNTMQGIDGEAMSVFQPEVVVGGATSALSRPIATRVLTALQAQNDVYMTEILGKRVAIDRLTGEALKAGVDETSRLFRLQYPHAQDTIMDISLGDVSKAVFNKDFIEVKFGRTTGETFDTAGEANLFMKDRLGLENYEVRQVGDNKYIGVVTKDIDETSDAVRAALEIQTKNATPQSRTGFLLNLVKSRTGKVSQETMSDLELATYGASSLSRTAKQLYSEIGELSKGEYKQFRSFMNYQRDVSDPLTGLRGTYSDNIGAFERAWEHRFKEMPSDKMIATYFTHVNMNNWDWVLRNLQVYTLKARKGIESFKIKLAPDAEVSLEGKFLDDIPWEVTDDAGIADLTKGKFMSDDPVTARKNWMGADERKHVQDMIKDGRAKVIALTDDGERALKESGLYAERLGNGKIHYVLVENNYTTEALKTKHVPYRPGGHVEHANGSYYIRQPEIALGSGSQKVRTYLGDKTLLAFDGEAKAAKYLPLYNKGREIYKEVLAGRAAMSDLKFFLENSLPDSLKDFQLLFDKKNGLGLDVNEPFHITPKGKNVGDVTDLSKRFTDKIPFEYAQRNNHRILSSEDIVRYTGERDGVLMTIDELGSSANPGINFKPASTLDAINTLSQSTLALMRGRYLDDVKLKYAEHFLAEFSDVLDDGYKATIRDPYSGLLDAKFKTDFADKTRLTAAKAYRQSMSEFLGLRSEGQQHFDWMRQKLADSVYKRTGDKGLKLVAPHLLYRETDPVSFAKNFAFHTKLGLFNPKQLLMQAQAVVHVAGIEGAQRATQAALTSTIQHAVKISGNKAVIDSLADKAVSLGWNKKHFIEATEGLQRTGFGHVGREVSYRESMFSDRLVENKMGKFLDTGNLFFNAGESTGRLTAWNSAYLRWRAANPTAAFNDKAIKEVLARANVLTLHMSSAANASWQYGLKSIPTQFFGYRARMMEQFLGKELTIAEKSRIFGTYSAVYGIPLALTVPSAIWPINETIRKYAAENGYDLDDGVALTAINQGITGVIAGAIAGEPTNASDVFGPNALNIFKDMVRGEKSFSEMLGGASGTVFADMYRKGMPILGDLMDTISGKETASFATTTQDIYDFLATINTLKQGQKAWYLYNYGSYFSKNEGTMDKVDKPAVMAALSGLAGIDPKDINDAYLTLESIQDRKEVVKRETDKAIAEYRRGWEAQEKGNTSEANAHFARAKRHIDWGGLNPSEAGEALRKATQQSEVFTDRIDWDWARTSREAMEAYTEKTVRNREKNK